VRILVTGGAGYIGSIAAAELAAAGHTVTILDSLVTGHARAIPAEAVFVQADLSDRAALDQTLQQGRFDAVMHFAAFIEAGESMADPAKYFDNNLRVSLGLLDAVQRAGVPASSSRPLPPSTRPATAADRVDAPAQRLRADQVDDRQALEWYLHSRSAFRRLALLQRRRRSRRRGGDTPARKPPDRWCRSLSVGGRRPIFRDDYGPDTCIATTSTSPIWWRRTCSPYGRSGASRQIWPRQRRGAGAPGDRNRPRHRARHPRP
jgi:NAD(P)-dependent dehydrogenase (short-subunit alcohol dehydrogenase family)